MDSSPQNRDLPTAQVPIRLSTRDPDLKLPVETGSILVSTGLRRYALSTLVNNLLGSEKRVPFEFLINGQFLRTSIDEFLTAHGKSSEDTLDVEYLRALIPPTHLASFEHDDWVSSVDILSATSHAAAWSSSAAPVAPGHASIVSGSYDGLVRVWSQTADLIATSSPAIAGGHAQGVKSVKFLSPSKIVSCGNDRTIKIWSFSEDATETGARNGKLAPIFELYGHNSSVDAIAAHTPSARMLSASSDHSIGVWSTKKAGAPSAPEQLLPSAAAGVNKRRKLGLSKLSIPQRGPLGMLKSHTGPVTSAVFAAQDPTVAYSTSWDHTLLTWDLVAGAAVSTRRTMHPLLCSAELPQLGLLAAGTSARHIAMVDPRADARDVAGLTLRGHTGAVVAAAPEPENGFGLVSASLDGTCRVWDLRSVRVGPAALAESTGTGGAGQVGQSVYVIRREGLDDKEKRRAAGDGCKVFDVCWDSEVGIVSAGEDKKVQINQSMGR